MKVKLVYDGYTGKEVVSDFKVVPRVGERLMMKTGEIVEVLQVVHTPTNSAHDAEVVVKTVDE